MSGCYRASNLDRASKNWKDPDLDPDLDPIRILPLDIDRVRNTYGNYFLYNS